MKQTLLYLCALLYVGAAFADGGHTHQPQPANVSNAGAKADSRSTSVGVGIGGAGGSGGTAKATGGQATGGTSSSTLTQHATASSAVPAALAASNGTCMGSSTGGAQGPGFGVSVGSTWQDDSCNRRFNAMRLESLGQPRAAMALMCQDETVRVAMGDAGTPCPATRGPKLGDQQAQYTDPVIRRRLGLPPL